MYLDAVRQEGDSRGYALAAERINRARCGGRLTVSRGQIEHEWRHLRRKLTARDPRWLAALGPVTRPRAHPLFRVVAGEVEDWERGTQA